MIRSANLSDIGRLTAIYNEAILEGGLTGDLEPLSVDNRRLWFIEHGPPYGIFVKIVEASVVGYAALSPYRKGRGAFGETCELSYYLAKSHRGRRLGAELARRAIHEASHSGFRLIMAAVLGCNQTSINLLTKLEFSIMGRLPDAARVNTTYVDHIYLARALALNGPAPGDESR